MTFFLISAVTKRENQYASKRLEAPPVAEAPMDIDFRAFPIRRQAAPIVFDQGIFLVYHWFIINDPKYLNYSPSLC